MFRKIRCNSYVLLCSVCIGIYLICMKDFYFSIWQVPDFGAYAGFAQANLKAHDGFSSLFIFLSGLLTFLPMQIKISCLVFQTSAMSALFYFYYHIVKKDKGLHVEDVLAILITAFSSLWYYGYGKVYYDIPFTMVTFAVCLYILTRGILAYRQGNNRLYLWNLLFLTLGLCLSWKMYNLFLIAGFGLCALADNELWQIFFYNAVQMKKWFVFIGMFLLGYLIGNYHFLFFPMETMEGIMGYEASSDFLDRLFRTDYLVWDHVNLLPWNFSVMCVVTMACILFLLPICARRLKFIAISVFMIACFWVFITFFSRGYPWHGFTFGLFLILQFMFEIKSGFMEYKWVQKIAIVGILIQAMLCLCFYVPKQVEWETLTKQCIGDLIECEYQIRKDIQDAFKKTGGKPCAIDLAVKRNTLLYVNSSSFQKRSKDNLYILRSNYIFADPLQYANLDVWNELYARSCSIQEAEFILYIIPNKFKRMQDIACLHDYDNYEKTWSYEREVYSVYVYRRQQL